MIDLRQQHPLTRIGIEALNAQVLKEWPGQLVGHDTETLLPEPLALRFCVKEIT
jgi:hypothetical protein